MFGKVDADVMQQSQDYFFYTMITTPNVAIYSAISCYCRGQGETKRPMYIGIIANLINVIGNAVLIYGFNMAAKGAAIATSASRIISTTMIFIFVLKSKTLKIRIEKLFRYKPNKYYISNICKIGIPNGVENSMFEIGRVMLSSLVAGMGTISIAANTVAQSLVSFQYTQGTAMGAGLITVVGTCIGADEKEQAQKYTKKILKFEYFSMIIVSLILCVFSSFFIGLFNLSPESALISKKLLYIHSIMACTVWPIAFVLPNAFRAATDIKFITIVTMVAMWAFRVALSYVFAYFCGFGIYSIWFAMFADWLFRICFFIPRFTSRRWLKKYNG
jgi:putative MATE family efflux protein